MNANSGTNNETALSLVPISINAPASSSFNAEWTVEHERILVEWADKAMCYRWLHSRSHAMFSSLNAWYTIPVIIISTVTGTANFAQERVPYEYQSLFVMMVGAFNILAGIITTIQQFLKITQLNEAHRVSSIAWDKFYRNIKIELSKHPDERMNVTQMIKLSKEEFDRLMETSPTIPDKIIRIFKEEFHLTQEQKEHNRPLYSNMPNMPVPKIFTPEICDTLISTDIYRNPWSSEENQTKKREQKWNREKQSTETILSFKKTFREINNRDPLDTEILDNLKDKVEPHILSQFISNLSASELGMAREVI